MNLLTGIGMRERSPNPGQNVDVIAGSTISLFSGAGGLDLGVERAGFKTVAAVEWDDDAADSMEKNAPDYFPELREVMRADLYPLATGSGGGVTTRDILRAGGLGLARIQISSSVDRRASPSRSPVSGSTGSGTASTLPPACSRRTRASSLRLDRGSSSWRTSTHSPSTTRRVDRRSRDC